MSDYIKTVDFAAKDSLITGNPSKIVSGTEINTEFNNIATAIVTKANTASPTLTTPNIGVATGTSLALTGGASGTTWTGNVTGNVTGNATGSSGSCTGNSATATNATNATNVTGSGTVSATTTGGAALTPNNAGNVTGIVAIANGGTGQSIAAAAFHALAGLNNPGASSGYFTAGYFRIQYGTTGSIATNSTANITLPTSYGNGLLYVYMTPKNTINNNCAIGFSALVTGNNTFTAKHYSTDSSSMDYAYIALGLQ